MQCKKCGYTNNTTSNYCKQCGVLLSNTTLCEECHTEISVFDQYCDHCGLKNDQYIKRAHLPKKLREDTPGFYSGIVRGEFVAKVIFFSFVSMIVFFITLISLLT